MSTWSMQYEHHNPRRPKCRACVSWDGPLCNNWNPCRNQKADVSRKLMRRHNDKACRQFCLRDGADA